MSNSSTYTRTDAYNSRGRSGGINYGNPYSSAGYGASRAYLMPAQQNYDEDGQQQHQRKMGTRRTVDYTGGVARWMHKRVTGPYTREPGVIRPKKCFIIDVYPPAAYLDNPIMSVTPKFVHTSVNKLRHPVNLVRWTPEGRRILGASSSGEFTLWNGMSFNFETIMQAHDQSIRAGEWSHNDDWFVSGDQDGIVKYWQPNMNNVKVIAAHREAIRDISFSRADSKFVTASDDSTLKIWNFNEGMVERTLSGHGWDVKCCDWHPSKGLIASGSKDNLVKLWDPRTEKCLTTLHGHKNTITRAEFQPTRGDLLATSSRDQTTRIFDLRVMKDIFVLRGASSDMTTLTWHPVHDSLLAVGDFSGAVYFYVLDSSQSVSSVTSITGSHSSSKQQSAILSMGSIAQSVDPIQTIPYAHESAIWSMQFHPMGHILCTGSNDKFTKFWCRARPGDDEAFKDASHLGPEAQGQNPHSYGESRTGSRYNNSNYD
ncbi:WD40-repeat-containing domain protein [Lipomyces oligophaga]|uniref:WD40-repeat-containing domain protein n=1 Tax=Lipomyces oligophaga TaxID=45792 RepID=UPI0034CE1964